MVQKSPNRSSNQPNRRPNRGKWISALSWGTLFVAFGTFYGIWNTVSQHTSLADQPAAESSVQPNAGADGGDAGMQPFQGSQSGDDNSQFSNQGGDQFGSSFGSVSPHRGRSFDFSSRAS